MLRSIPGQLSRNHRRYASKAVIGDVEDSKELELLKALEDSKTVNIAYQVDDPNVGMGLTRNENYYKLYICDTGLFVTLAFWNKNFTDNEIYQKLLSDKLSANLGYVYENLVAQMLVANGHELFYHFWPRDEKHYFEIDFMISNGAKIFPIEVKSSGYRSHASLDEFSRKYSSQIQSRYLIYTKDLGHEEDTTLVPVYMTLFI